MKSRVWCLIVVAFLLAGSVSAQAAQFGDFTYESSGSGVTITRYTGPGGDVSILETINGLPVISIGQYAFRNCPSLTSVTIPDSVSGIGDGAFWGCTGLTSVTIPDSVTAIGNQGFYECTGLTSVAIPKNVTYLGPQTFLGCTGLTNITIPDSVTGIGGSAFEGCTGLTSVTVPGSVNSIEHLTFNGCTSLTSVTILGGVTSIGGGAFYGCTGLTSITIPDSITNIEWAAFSGCTSLTSITIPDSVTSIGDWAFSGCTKLSLKISSGVMSISGWKLASMRGLAAIEVHALNPVYSSVDGVLYNKNQTTVVLCPRGRLGSVTIPGSVTSIAYEAFKDCVGLQVVYFLGDAPAHAEDAFANTPATLFYVAGSSEWESTLAGRPTVSWNGLFGAQSLEMYAGLTIIGEIGKVYSIEYVTDLTDPAESDWRCLEYLQLPVSPYLWADKSAPVTGKRFYRAVAMEPPENMVFIPPGTFRMGSPEDEVDRRDNEGPQTSVAISRGYWMGKYEVTQGEYLAVMGDNPSWFNGVRYAGEEYETDYGVNHDRPVETVSWDDATEYCAKLTERERLAGRIAPDSVYRLPTEAEWEYACRAWTSTRFSYGDDAGYIEPGSYVNVGYTNLTNYAWYEDNSDGQTHPVGQKLPNPWGLYDMHGNVWELCQDWWNDSLPGGVVLDPQGPATGSGRVVRGGSSSYWADYVAPLGCRSAGRIGGYFAENGGISNGGTSIGFRAVLAPGQ